jgi:hypothetical protein
MSDVTVTCACGRLMAVVSSLGPSHFRCANCRTRVHVESPMLDANRARCRWISKTRCENPRTDDLPLCTDHLMTAARWALIHPDTRQALIDQYEGDEFSRAYFGVWDKAREEAAQRAKESREHQERIRPPVDVVYYVRLGPDRIKIGYTARFNERMGSLRVYDEANILAVEPGNRKVEKRRHYQFADLRIHTHREDFQPASDLLNHIEQVRSEYGEPVALVARLQEEARVIS